MTLLAKHRLGQAYLYNDVRIYNIIFYSDNGKIASTDGYLKFNDNEINYLEIEQITNRNKINLTKKENFVVKSGYKNFLTNKQDVNLYIYVDNKNVFIKEVGNRIETTEQDYNLTTSNFYYRTFEGKINDKKFNFEYLDKCETIKNENQEKAQKLYRKIKEQTYISISESDFMRLFNICNISMRKEKILKAV